MIKKLESLYDLDTLLWVEDTVAKLKVKDFEGLDLENLIEEIDHMGRSQKKELKSRLLVLLEHLLKRLNVDSPDDYRGWENTIYEQRQQIEIEIDDSPSLKVIWSEAFDFAWKLALKRVRQQYPKTQFSDRWTYENDLDSILNINFWE
jgi:hypothetical protein